MKSIALLKNGQKVSLVNFKTRDKVATGTIIQPVIFHDNYVKYIVELDSKSVLSNFEKTISYRHIVADPCSLEVNE
ncbi:MAG: hypothetical protein WC942_09860 [Clostridia bacterium]|jgi:hypothetical protein